ncbi:hypothetical protein HPB49_012368 [Dermacentor silvarum]|uniref:Uncharacterized protein n=1 Tax=Dermacentor silvarum TaxID=543639 RepID=A0ACB8DZC7_DERSI|nr:hypothetical protein HPB49_012368 [Dermacentor silvarum]
MRLQCCRASANDVLGKTSTSVVYRGEINQGPTVNNLTVLTQPLGENLYDGLKEKILTRALPTECTRLQQLLTSEELGDRCPSQMLYWMRQLLGEGNFNTHSALLKELFLQRLTQPVRLVLAAADDTTLGHLAELDDKIHEAAAPSVSIIATAPEPSAVAQLDGCIYNLTAAIASLHGPTRRQRSSSSLELRGPCRGLEECWRRLGS